jgi:hypothetical protein
MSLPQPIMGTVVGDLADSPYMLFRERAIAAASLEALSSAAELEQGERRRT